MKPVIQRELDEIRKLIADLEKRLKNEKEQLGYRPVFDYGRRGDVPAPTEAQRGMALTTDGWATVTGSGGGGGAGTPDGHTLAVVTGVLNAEPLSGTIDARFKNLSGSIDGRFATISSVSPDGTTLASVTGVLNALPLSGTIDARIKNLSGSVTGRFNDLSGSVDGHFNALSGTINSAIVGLLSGSQVWTQTAVGTEGTTLSAVLPVPFANADYHAWVTNYEGTYSPAFKIQNKTASGFQVVSTAPYLAGDKIDLLAVSSTLGAVADGTAIANLSGTINSAIVHLSSTLGGTTVPTLSSIAFSTPGAAINLSTEGTIDWIRTHWDWNAYDHARTREAAGSELHRKLFGGAPGLALVDTLRAVHGTTWPLHNSNTIAGTTFATTVTDDSWGIASGPNTSYSVFWTNSSAMLNYGWDFSVPVRSYAQVVRIYFTQHSATTQVSVEAIGSNVTSSNTVVAGNTGTDTRRLATFTIGAGTTGELVKVRITNTTNPASNASLCLAGITIATS